MLFLVPIFTDVGCYEDSIPSLESGDDKDQILDSTAADREDAVKKCAIAAFKRGYKAFALQQGSCHASIDAVVTYSKLGRSSKCAGDGKGGPQANRVYIFNPGMFISFIYTYNKYFHNPKIIARFLMRTVIMVSFTSSVNLLRGPWFF